MLLNEIIFRHFKLQMNSFHNKTRDTRHTSKIRRWVLLYNVTWKEMIADLLCSMSTLYF